MTHPRPPSILCQPDPHKSCGACCGMYNRADGGRAATHARLRERTLAYRNDAQIEDEASLREFRSRWEPAASSKLMAELPNCPFLGLIDVDKAEDDAATSRVGCLVHPLQNDGLDGRDCGVYDRHTCEDYLCAAHEVLRPIEAWLVVEAIEDSYLYGIVVTDPRFVRELFERTADLNGAMPTAGAVMERGARAARGYFGLKVEWPYRADDGVFGQVEAGDGLETPRRPGPSEQLGVPADAWENALRCLGTECASLAELEDARARVSAAVREFAETVAAGR